MRVVGLSLVLAACLAFVDARIVKIGKSGKVIVKIDPTVHASGRFALPVLSNGRTAAAKLVQVPEVNFVAAVVPVANQEDIQTLNKTAGVLGVYENKEIKAPPKISKASEVEKDTIDENLAHQITGVLRVRAKYGVTGKGVKVGIIDSGLDWKHPALGAGTSFPTERVPFGYDFVGDDFKSGGEPVPDDDPMDCGGHGTHVAGIIGANSTATYIFTGVAPEVTFGAYRVFGCDGATDTAVILQAIQRAFSDGMEVINMSLGSDGGFGVNDPEVDLINAISATGKVIFAIAQGNAQSGGVWQSSAPALAERATSVAATNNLATLRTRSFTVAGKRFNMTVYDNARVPTNPLDIILNVNAAPAPGASANTDACTGTAQLPGTITNPTGKVLLIRRGTCGFLEKAQNAQAAGAAAVIIYNHGLSAFPALYDYTADAATKVTIPVYAMDETSGSALAVLLLSQPTLSSKFEVDAADAEVSVPQITITSFSSWGPPPDLRFKPDVAAPGSNILSTLPLAQGGFGFESGTSMATPYTAGIIALYLQYANFIASGNLPSTTTVTTTTVTITTAEPSASDLPATSDVPATSDLPTSAATSDVASSAVTSEVATSAASSDVVPSAPATSAATSAAASDVASSSATSEVRTSALTSAITSDVATSAVTSDVATSAATSDVATSAATSDVATSAATSDVATSAATSDVATSAATSDVATSAATSDVATSAATSDVATSAATSNVASSAATSGVPTSAVTSAPTSVATSGVPTSAATSVVASSAATSGIPTSAVVSSSAATSVVPSSAQTSATSSGAGGYSTIATSDVVGYSTNGQSSPLATSTSVVVSTPVVSSTNPVTSASTDSTIVETIVDDPTDAFPPISPTSPTGPPTTSPLKCRPRPTSSFGPTPTPGGYGRKIRRADSLPLLAELFDRDPLFVRSRLQNAGKQLNQGSSSFLDTAFLQGGGLIQVEQLFGTRVVASPGKFELGSFQTTQIQKFTIKNYDTVTQTVVITNAPGLTADITNPNSVVYQALSAGVSFSVNGGSDSTTLTLDVASGASVEVTATFTLSSDLLAYTSSKKAIVLVSGWIKVTANDVSNSIVYGGLSGDRTNYKWFESVPRGLETNGWYAAPGWVLNRATVTTSPITTPLASLRSLIALLRVIVPLGEFNTFIFTSTGTNLGYIPDLIFTEVPRNNNDNTSAGNYEYQVEWTNFQYVDRNNVLRRLTTGSYIIAIQGVFAQAINENAPVAASTLLQFPTITLR